jgi:sulfonate transport system substrate-binding protein
MFRFEVMRAFGRPAVMAALALVASVVAAGCQTRAQGGGGETGTAVLRVASQKGGTRAMLTAAGVLGELPYRIEWAEFPAAQHLLEALGAAAVDVGGVGDAPFQFAYQAGSPIKAVQAIRYDPGTTASAILVPAGSTIRTLLDLKGRRVATGRGSAGHYLLLRALDKAHLAVGDVTLVFLAPGDAKAAFSSGAVDAWSTWNPYVGAAVLHDGARVLPDSLGLSTGTGFIAASERAIKEKRALIEDFLRRNARAQQWAVSHAADFARVLAAETGLPADVARYTADRGVRGTVPIDGALLAEQRQVLATFRTAGALPPERSVAQRSFEDGFDPTLFRGTD